jgi:hypothetical protein
MAILLIIAIGMEVFLADVIKPKTRFGYIVIGTFASGIISTILVEKLDAKITGS